MLGVTRGWRQIHLASPGHFSNVSALIVQGSMLVTDDDRSLNYADLERGFLGGASAEDVLRLLAKTVQEQSVVIRELAENARDARHPKHKRAEKRLRQIARDIVQQELIDRDSPSDHKPPPAKRRSPGHVSYTKAEFDPKLRATIRELWDPDNYEKLTVANVLAHLNVSSANTLWGLLKDYGYAQSGETLARCLHRLAEEWHPEWHGINRQRF